MQNDYVILKKICGIIQECLRTQYSNSTLRLYDIYEQICKVDELLIRFPSPYGFSRFMRKMHNEGILKQFITNYNADTQTYHHYNWYFYPKDIVLDKTPARSGLLEDSNTSRFIPLGFKHKANNGILVRSKDELYIMNQLLNEPDLTIYYEREFLVSKMKKCYPDFTIENKRNQRIFVWEHFGLINDCQYCEDMVRKISFYNKLGFLGISAKNKYTFIATINKNSLQFSTLVEEYIKEIKKEN